MSDPETVPFSDIFAAAIADWPEGLVLLSPQSEVLMLNPLARELLGIEVGSHLLSDGLCSEESFSSLLGPGTPPGRVELGGRIYDCRMTHLRHEAGGLLLMLQPSERQPEDLQQTARFLDSIVENIPDMIFVKDAKELRFQRFNKAGERLLGIPQEELLGRNDYDFFPKEQADFFVARDRYTLAGKTVLDIPEEPVETRNGQRWLHTKKIPILDDQGEPVYLLGISADITAQKNAEMALLRINEELERRVEETVATLRQTQEQLLQSQKMEALGRLAGGVAHDFNNLLTVISGYGEMLQYDPEASPEIKRNSEQVLAAAQRATDLTRQMLAFSRQQFLQPSVLYLNDRVRGIHKLLERLIGEDVSLSLKLEPRPLKILADPGQVDQVIMNLAVNARDAMPNGGQLTIETRNVTLDAEMVKHLPDLSPGRYVMLAIADTGSGIDEETQSRIFEPFYTTKEKGRGTGLGLATTYGIVKQSLGHIQLDSELGKGSVFKIYLPATEDLPQLQSEPGPIQMQWLASETLLLVEDEPAVCKLLSKVLEKEGYRVLTAPHGQAALALARGYEETIDLVLTDLVMPGISGRELGETLSKERPGIKLVYMSGYSDDALFQEGKLDEGAAFIHKPFRPDALLRLLQKVLSSEQNA